MLGLFQNKTSSKLQLVFEFIKTFGDYIILVLLEVIAQVVGDRKPFEQRFNVLDPTISFPKAEHEKVSAAMLYVYCFGVPIASVLIVSFVFGPGQLKRRLVLFNWSLLGVVTSVVYAQLFTEVIKVIIGRPRPDFLSRCQIDTAKVQAAFSATAVALFDSSICTTTNTKALRDGFRSFPSGHSSMSFAGLTFLALYLAGQFRLFSAHSRHGKHLYAYTITAIPLLLASFVTSSRVSDFRHRGSDVVGGAAIGIFFAIMAFRYYYPWPNSQSSNTPWMVLRAESGDGFGTRDRSASTTSNPLLPTTNQGLGVPRAQGAVSPYSDGSYDHSGNPMELQPVPQINLQHPSTT